MPYKHNDPRRHKIPKAKYKISNWREYDQGNCSTHPLISKYLIHNDSFGRYAAAQQQRRFRCSVEGKY
jgi:hypothetical protein